MHELKSVHFIAITSDNWQSNSLNDYLSLTCHYIDTSFIMQNKVLSLRYMTESKTADYLFESINSILKEWNVQDKVSSYISNKYLIYFSNDSLL
jgi:hypothetical protein